jgi:hypothetical protein
MRLRAPNLLQRHQIAILAAISAVLPLLFAGQEVHATPGAGTRLGVAEAQGPAARSLTALHHNPAMLAGMPGTRVQLGATGGLDQRWIRRYAVGPDGAPGGALGERESLLNPNVGYFAAASFYFEPFAFGFGVYDRGSQFDLQSTDAQRWHLAPDPDQSALLCGKNDSRRVQGQRRAGVAAHRLHAGDRVEHPRQPAHRRQRALPPPAQPLRLRQQPGAGHHDGRG